MIKRAIKLSLDGATLPTEFRLFVAGWNETENGRFLFDDAAAKSVMAAYREWGVDLAIDLEHQMLDVQPGAADPTARDARGYCKLELRNGDLWACDVKWTPDGARRLQEKTQRYVSPAFDIDPKSKRVLKIINVAITAMPATHNTPALVAASVGVKMNPDLVKKALDALQAGDDEAAQEILKSMIAQAASGGADGDADGSEGDGAEGVPEQDSVTDPEVVENDAVDGDGPPSSKKPGAGDDDDDDDDDKPAKKMARKAGVAMLCRLTGKASLEEALLEVETYRASHLTLETERQKLAKDRATLESAERRKLCVELITLGAEFPATIWADPTAKHPSKLKTRWAKMSIDELKTHVAEQKEARGGKREPAVKPPPGPAGDAGAQSVTLTSGKVVQLSADEVRICKSQGADLKDFATLKVRRDSVKG